MKWSWKIGEVAGIGIYVHATFLILLVWVAVTYYIAGQSIAMMLNAIVFLLSLFGIVVLHELGHLHFDEPYRRFRAHGLIVKDGAKMSKSRGNVVDPWQMIEKYGADTVRWYFYTVNAVGEPTMFSEEAVREKQRKFIMTVLNSVMFLETYWDGAESEEKKIDVLDEWVVSEMNDTVGRVTKGLESYDIVRSARAIAEFVEDLSNWYIRRSRDRLQSMIMTR